MYLRMRASTFFLATFSFCCVPSQSRQSSHAIASNSSLANAMCPDQKHSCSDRTTCCQLADTSYGCCPFNNAVCCSDFVHCCPSDTVCDLKHGLCKMNHASNHIGMRVWETIQPQGPTVRGQTPESLPLQSVLETLAIGGSGGILETSFSNTSKTVCPDGRSTCSESYSCCPSPSGAYGCCPFKDAVCCSDKIHCCPKDLTCDVKGGRCVKAVVERVVKNVICPGGEFQCPDRATCCSLVGGQYGCCPLENATCCPDKLHCCPEGFGCDGGSCTRSKNTTLSDL